MFPPKNIKLTLEAFHQEFDKTLCWIQWVTEAAHLETEVLWPCCYQLHICWSKWSDAFFAGPKITSQTQLGW